MSNAHPSERNPPSFWQAALKLKTRLFLIGCVLSLTLLALFPRTRLREMLRHPLAMECPTPLAGPERAKAAADRVRPGLERDLTTMGLHFGDPVFLRAFKEERQLELWIRRRDGGKYELFRTWDIVRQSGKPGPKLAEGDHQVPEGFYAVASAAMKPDSIYHLAFNIGFPNTCDRQHGRTGSSIMIHGDRVSIGCLAMTDDKIEEIYTLCDAALKAGQDRFSVHIFPFRMTDERMEKERASPWFSFWKEIKTGHDFFEREKTPPEVTAENGNYRFKALKE